MTSLVDSAIEVLGALYATTKDTPVHILLLALATTVACGLGIIYALVFLLAPTPRSPHPSEKTYITTTSSGSITKPKPLPCWHDGWLAHRNDASGSTQDKKHTGSIDGPEVMMSVVVPAYNEEDRIEIMLQEAVEFLDLEYGREANKGKGGKGLRGYEILIVNDGSKDKTVEVVLDFSKKNGLHDILRVCTLEENRGKGGAVTHGFRHVRGAYAVFADADGASKFEDLQKLVKGCQKVEDGPGRGIAVGSRAHMRSALRNALMHSFHLLLRLLTPPATSRIRDTQCGFKLFSRASLPHIIPYMHAEGWIFDVEMLMLAESAPGGIQVAEEQIGWKEVGGSKLNVLWDSLAMAWGLALLRAGWVLGVYRRR